MNNKTIDISLINEISKKIILQIDASRQQMFEIVDNIRAEYESLKGQLAHIKYQVEQVIVEVDELEKQDKRIRKRLAEVSENFNQYTEEDVKAVYEKASDIRIKFYTKQTEEKALREKRNTLEIALKKSMSNIQTAEKIVNQISIALSYLEGDMSNALGIEDKNSDMFLGIKILEAQEYERQRIARDIHDGPAQHMANAIMRVDICETMLQRDLQEGLQELASLKESIQISLKEVRNIIFDLRPMSLDDLGLVEAIREMIAITISEQKLELNLQLKPIKNEVEPIIQVAIYRITQEIFNNIKKHAKAKRVAVKLDYGLHYLTLIVAEDGIGFDVDVTLEKVKTNTTSYGLIGILDRVNQLQGQIEIKSTQGIGTTYTIKFPVNREVVRYEQSRN